MRKLAAVVAMGLAMGGAALAQETEAEGYVGAFCSLREADRGNARFYLLSPSLADLVNRAQDVSDRIQAEAPDEKPPLGDGVPYQGYPDVAPVCEAGASLAEGETIVAEVNYIFPDEPDGNWTDRLVFVAGEGGVLVIDDIRYGAEGDDGSMRKTLEWVLAQ